MVQFRRALGIKVFPTCGLIRAFRGSFCWDYGTGVAATRCHTLRDGRQIIVSGPPKIHAAHDIHGDRGSPLYAVEDGEITLRNRVDDGTGGGFMVKLQAFDPPHRVYIYSHLDEPGLYGSGTEVVAGTKIGIMGSSGNAAGRGVHLHFQALELINGVLTPVNVYDEMLEALEIQEGVAPSGDMVALRGLDEYRMGYLPPPSLKGAAVYREQGDWVSCLVSPLPEDGAAVEEGEEDNGTGILIFAGLALGTLAYFTLRKA